MEQWSVSINTLPKAQLAGLFPRTSEPGR